MSLETTTFPNKHTWETTLLQRGLVDNCFEEGQYEIAIATLDQLRSSDFNPWPPHLRQLIYISLQSSEETNRLDELEHSQTSASSSKQASPLKHPKRQYSSLNHIPAKAILDAQKLLMSYLSTNSPKSLSRSLPTRKALSGLTHDGDSLVSKRSICIAQCKDCWEFLSSDFLSRHDTPAISQRSLALNTLSRYAIEGRVVSCLSDFSWPVLEWLVSLFEIDEREHDTGDVRYSPLLVEQIVDSNGKVYIETPVSIIIHCVQQNQPLYQRLAPRLLSLLAGLTTSSQVDLQTLVVALYTRLASTSIVGDISRLFSQTNQSAAILRLKLALYSRFVVAKTDLIDKPRPQPRSRLRNSKQNGNPDTIDSPRKSHNPTATEIVHLFQLESPKTKTDTSVNESFPTSLWFKYQLLTTYGTLQMIVPTKDRDSDWLRLLNGGLNQIVRNMLQNQGSEGDLYQRLLESQIVTWELSQIASA